MELRHLLEQREEAGNILPLHPGEKTQLSKAVSTRSNSAALRDNLCLPTKDRMSLTKRTRIVCCSIGARERSPAVSAYRYLSGALGAALTSGGLHRVRFAHDGQQRLQQHVQEALHHHLHLFLHRRLLDTRMMERSIISGFCKRGHNFTSHHLTLRNTMELVLMMEKMLLRIPEQMSSSLCWRRCR